jgi:hypothetical protein
VAAISGRQPGHRLASHRAAALERAGLLIMYRTICRKLCCRWIERVIKILYEAGGPPHVREILITLSSKKF